MMPGQCNGWNLFGDVLIMGVVHAMLMKRRRQDTNAMFDYVSDNAK